jgi:hypothetical protein
MKIALFSVVAVCLVPLAVGACAGDPSGEEGSSVDAITTLGQDEIVGSIAYGQTIGVEYTSTPARRAWRFDGRKGEIVELKAAATTGDAVAWIVDAASQALAFNDDATSTTKDSLATLQIPADGTYYVVVREKGYRSTHMDVSLRLVNGPRGDQLVPVCPMDESGCTTTGRLPIAICGADKHHPPTVSVGGGRVTVGCVPNGDQNVTPTLVFASDVDGSVKHTESLWTANGYYLTFLEQGRTAGAAQILYPYNCDDHGTFQSGWGWDCFDLRQYDLQGNLESQAQFGKDGNNSHPGLSWNGTLLASAWVSYDAIYFRTIPANGLIASADRGTATMLFRDAQSTDVRDDGRARLVWDSASGTFGIFALLGSGNVYFARVSPAGALVEEPRVVATKVTPQTFAGSLGAAAANGKFYVAFERAQADRYQRVLASVTPGTSGRTEVVLDDLASSDPRVSLATDGAQLYVATGTDRGAVHVLNADLAVLGKYDIDPRGDVRAPDVAYDTVNHALTLAWVTGAGEARMIWHMALPAQH